MLFTLVLMGEANPVKALPGFLCIGFCILAGVLLYLLPTFVAWYRGHPNTAAIAVLNILLGASVIGYIVALVWAFTEVKPKRRYGPGPEWEG